MKIFTFSNLIILSASFFLFIACSEEKQEEDLVKQAEAYIGEIKKFTMEGNCPEATNFHNLLVSHQQENLTAFPKEYDIVQKISRWGNQIEKCNEDLRRENKVSPSVTPPPIVPTPSKPQSEVVVVDEKKDPAPVEPVKPEIVPTPKEPVTPEPEEEEDEPIVPSNQTKVCNNPKYSGPKSDIRIVKLEVTDEETIITIGLFNIVEKNGYNIYPPGHAEAFHLDISQGKLFSPLRAVKDIKAGEQITFDTKTKTFRLFFDPIPSSISKINLIEGSAGIDPTQTYWNFRKIDLSCLQ